MKSSNEYITLIRSFLRQHADKNSDLDVFVELREPDPVIMGFIHDDPENICQCDIDLLRLRRGLNSLLLKRIEKDAIYA